MFKLMKLEVKKYQLKGYIKGVVIANLVILAFIFFISYSSKYETKAAIENYAMLFSVVDTFVRVTFIIFASVVISRLIIDEYKSKTITVMFMYPINRKKIILAKLIVVVVCAFLTMIISNVFIVSSFYVGNEVLNFVQDKLTMDLIIINSINIISHAFTASFISLISLYFGMRKKSVPATIISASIIASVICSNGNGNEIYSITPIPFLLAAIGAFIGYLTIKNIESVDIAN